MFISAYPVTWGLFSLVGGIIGLGAQSGSVSKVKNVIKTHIKYGIALIKLRNIIMNEKFVILFTFSY